MLAVGRITSVYGVKGWVKIDSATEPRENLFSYQPWYIADQDGWQMIQIDEYRQHGKGYAGHISGVDDRDLAQAYCRKDICVEKRLLPELANDEHYWHQLQGLKVYSVGDVKNILPGERVLLGKVSGLMETGANDVLVVTSCNDSIDNRERLVPWLKEFLHSVDLDRGEIEVQWDPAF
ncbi:MAG: ribosome maturation factor RimM [Gammaproteobacteria bacterium]|nr:MAG: ribosome maturation factor RimM [Gammaproteobacteria bacterium]RLA54797.1 MAG: ribosome maturation factor RimM [Gammaproteobacteria bacterium]